MISFKDSQSNTCKNNNNPTSLCCIFVSCLLATVSMLRPIQTSLNLYLVPATLCKPDGTEATKDWGSCGMLKNKRQNKTKQKKSPPFYWWTDTFVNRWYYHYWVWKGHPWKTQSLTGKERLRFNFDHRHLVWRFSLIHVMVTQRGLNDRTWM